MLRAIGTTVLALFVGVVIGLGVDKVDGTNPPRTCFDTTTTALVPAN